MQESTVEVPVVVYSEDNRPVSFMHLDTDMFSMKVI